ncbi:autotransporter beta-domain protein [Chlamydia ibidis]|uniref:Autotransporter beta-domain protein n=2 Tax=Chlamydia ibidis TaxID=1405396 RepID=S7KLY4_9CHLA|nr:autotransporter outer membrane beta-barrel domain-containing protein [Chlamydia ibidis]EPP35455.1 autotransporter beta-domain protein [Chlamydia ibidis]EQM63136.1 autotransporter beta-domain protein [Chlamydia ibidis 10-1398/6]
MKASLRKLLFSTTLTVPFASQAFSVEIPLPHGVYDGHVNELIFPYTITSYADGATLLLQGDLSIVNFNNATSGTPLGCLKNTAGPLSIVGGGHNLKFLRILSTGDGSAINNAVNSSSTTVLSGFNTLIFENCEALQYNQPGLSVPITMTLIKPSGTIASSAPLTLSNINTLTFLNNKALGNGGGIHGTTVNISNIKKSLTFQGNMSSCGGAIAATEGLNITNNSGSILFRLNSVTDKGGAIYLGPKENTTESAAAVVATHAAIPAKAMKKSISMAAAAAAATAGASMQTNTNSSISNNAEVQFDANTAKAGGAIYAIGNINFDNNKSLIFQNNAASPELSPPEEAGNGGAIYCVKATNGPASHTLQANELTPSGLTITHQNTIFFANNVASKQGGAIYGENVSITSSGPTLFTNNNASNGGAIFIKGGGSLTLSADYGDMIFDGNTKVANGEAARNAISLDKDAKIKSLSASGSYKLIFADPITSVPPSQTAAQALQAGQADANTLTINPVRGDNSPFTNYIGSVVFTDVTPAPAVGVPLGGIKSEIHQPVTLAGGSLVLEKGVTLSVLSFNQQSGSTLLMGSGTTLTTTTNKDAGAATTMHSLSAEASAYAYTMASSALEAPKVAPAPAAKAATLNNDGSITVNGLHINLDSFMTSSSPAAKISVTGSNGTATISGPIYIDDLSGKAYENHDLFNKDTVTLQLCEVSTAKTGGPTITSPAPAPAGGPSASMAMASDAGTSSTPNGVVSDVATQSGNDTRIKLTAEQNVPFQPLGDTSPTYGYQGTWELQWVDGASEQAGNRSRAKAGSTNSKVLKATWTKIGFKPSPERIASLVPNSLWGSFIDLRAINDLATSSCDGFNYGKGLWVSGVTNIFHHDRDTEHQGYRRISGGCAIGLNSQTMSGSIFGIAYAQIFASSKDYVVSTTRSDACIGSIYASTRRPIGKSRMFFKSFAARVNYSHNKEKMKTRYTSVPETDGNWDNNCWLGEIGGSLPIEVRSEILNLNQIIPFAHVQVAYAEHGSFRERLAEARSFEGSRLINVATPVGLKIDRRSHANPDFYTLSVSYIPDLYRRNPACTTLLLANGVSWKTKATNLERNAVLIQGSSHTTVNSNIEIFSHGSCEVRKSSRNYSVNIGTKFRF